MNLLCINIINAFNIPILILSPDKKERKKERKNVDHRGLFILFSQYLHSKFQNVLFPGSGTSTLPQVLHCVTEYTENVAIANAGTGKSTLPQVLHCATNNAES